MTTPSSRKLIWRYVALIIWMMVISFASTAEFSADNTSLIVRPLLLWLFPEISQQKIDVAHFLIRKSAHLTEYAILGLLAARAFIVSSHQFWRRGWFPASLALVVLHALLDEYHQSFVPSRSGSLYDSLIDIAGGLMALAAFAYLDHRAKTRFQGSAIQT